LYVRVLREISKKTLRQFWEIHEDCENQLLGWYKEVKVAKYQNPKEILEAFPNSRAIGSGRFIFNIKGNNYRLVVKVNFKLKTIWIRFIGTHSQFDKIDSLEI